jgi:hypothetical protein
LIVLTAKTSALKRKEIPENIDSLLILIGFLMGGLLCDIKIEYCMLILNMQYFFKGENRCEICMKGNNLFLYHSDKIVITYQPIIAPVEKHVNLSVGERPSNGS